MMMDRQITLLHYSNVLVASAGNTNQFTVKPVEKRPPKGKTEHGLYKNVSRISGITLFNL